VLGGEVAVGIAEQGLRGGNQFRVVVARAQRQAGVGRCSHRVDIGIVSVTRMSVMIESRNFLDLPQQTLINLLHIVTGKRARLRGGEDDRRARNGEQNRSRKSNSQKCNSHETSSRQRRFAS
jgi:hypothetical protein